ncbi:DNA-binding transcriptional LysR family regulator [Bradyrhizobium sp. GM0.4]
MLGSQQSSLSRRISEFEHDLGVPFFERFSGGVRPTRPATFFGWPEPSWAARFATARSVHNSETGRLSVGFCTSLSDGNLQASLLEFKQRFPQSTITDTFSSGTS